MKLERRYLTVDGRERTYLYGVPENPRQRIMMALHGGGSRAALAVEQFRLLEFAEERGITLIVPDGTSKHDLKWYRKLVPERFHLRTWNALHGAMGYAAQARVDDLKFLIGLIARHTVWRDFEVLAMGMSNGSQMAQALGTRTPVTFVAGVSGIIPSTDHMARGERYPRIYIAHGEKDKSAPVKGGPAAFDPSYTHPNTYHRVARLRMFAEVDFRLHEFGHIWRPWQTREICDHFGWGASVLP